MNDICEYTLTTNPNTQMTKIYMKAGGIKGNINNTND